MVTTTDDETSPGHAHKVLVVEDDSWLTAMLQEALEALGCTVLKASSLSEGTALAETAEVDAAVLDMNIAGKRVYPVADVLTRRNIPFLFVTGYVNAEMPERFRDRPLLFKPFHLAELQKGLDRCFASTRSLA
jgi:CheY-like chemotaxis protein